MNPLSFNSDHRRLSCLAAVTGLFLLRYIFLGGYLAACVLFAQHPALADDGSTNDAWKKAVDQTWSAYEQAQKGKKAYQEPNDFVTDYVTSNYKDLILGPPISADMHALFQAFFRGVDGLRGTGEGACWKAAYNHAWSHASDLSKEGILNGFARVWLDLIEKLTGGSEEAVKWATEYLNGTKSKEHIIGQMRAFFKEKKPETYVDSWTDSYGCEIAVAATLDKANCRYEIVLTGYCKCKSLPIFLSPARAGVKYWTLISRGTLVLDPMAPYGIRFSDSVPLFRPNCDCTDGVETPGPSGGSAIGTPTPGHREPEPIDLDPFDCANVDCIGLVMLIDKTERYIDELIRQRNKLPEGSDEYNSVKSYIKTAAIMQQGFLQDYYRCCQRSLDATPASKIPDAFKQALLKYNSIANKYYPEGGRTPADETEGEGDEESSSGDPDPLPVCPPCANRAAEVERLKSEADRLFVQGQKLRSQIQEKSTRRDAFEKEVAELKREISENTKFQAVILDENGQPIQGAGDPPAIKAKKSELAAKQQQLEEIVVEIDADFDAWRNNSREQDSVQQKLEAARKALQKCTESKCTPSSGDALPKGEGKLGFIGPHPTDQFGTVGYEVVFTHTGGAAITHLTFGVQPKNAVVSSITMEDTDLEELAPEWVNLQIVDGNAVGEVVLGLASAKSFPKNTSTVLSQLELKINPLEDDSLVSFGIAGTLDFDAFPEYKLYDGTETQPSGSGTPADAPLVDVDLEIPVDASNTVVDGFTVNHDVNSNGVVDLADPLALLDHEVDNDNVQDAIHFTTVLNGNVQPPQTNDIIDSVNGGEPEASEDEEHVDLVEAATTGTADVDVAGGEVVSFHIDIAIDTQMYVQLGEDGPVVAALFGFVQDETTVEQDALPPEPDFVFDGNLQLLIEHMLAAIICPNVLMCCDDNALVTDNFPPSPPAPFEPSPFIPGSYKAALFTILANHGIAETLLQGIADVGGDIKDVHVVALGTGTKASYNTETDTIRISTTFDLGDGSLRESRSLISSVAHETLHAYFDQVVKAGHDSDTLVTLQESVDWIQNQSLREEASANVYTPGDHPLVVWWYSMDFAEEYAGQVANHLVDRHLRIEGKLKSGVDGDGDPYHLSDAQEEWDGVVESATTTGRFPAYVGENDTQYVIEAPPPVELADKLIELMDLGFNYR